MDKTLEEMKEEMHRMMTTPPGTCWKCGAHFFTMSPRTECSKCLGGLFGGIEPFSPKWFLIVIVVTAALTLPLMWACSH